MKILKNNLSYIGILLCFSGCVPLVGRKICNNLNKFEKNSDELIARVSSIPDTPFFAQIEDLSEDLELMYNLIIRYRFFGESEAVKDFYTQEMERSGWKIIMKVHASILVIVFEKPNLVAILEIYQKEQHYRIILGRKIHT